ncbi:MAG TPA: TetR/AcrR family transcriptional regulator, partial [Acidimicrobiales bacterium]|nr:TetR/AcrR family transcriptional regulator [Acidimicrobiales bacterium]
MPRINAENLEAHRAQQRTALLDAWRDLINEHGFAGTSLADVAARAGVSRTTIYNYFPDKEELLYALLDREAAAMVERARALLADAPTAAEAMARYIEMSMREFASNEVASHDLVPELGPEGMHRILDHLKPITELPTEIVERGVASGEFREVDVAAVVRLITGCVGAERLPVATGAHDADEAIDVVTTFVLHALGAGDA